MHDHSQVIDPIGVAGPLLRKTSLLCARGNPISGALTTRLHNSASDRSTKYIAAVPCCPSWPAMLVGPGRAALYCAARVRDQVRGLRKV